MGEGAIRLAESSMQKLGHFDSLQVSAEAQDKWALLNGATAPSNLYPER
jgi:hypothetical protein